MFSRNRDFVHFKLQAGNEIGKNLFHGQCNVYPNLQQKNKRTCQKSKTLYKHVEKRMRSYLSGLRISSTLIFMSSCDIVWKNITKISLFVMFIIFFLVLVSTFCVFFFNFFFLIFFIFDSLKNRTKTVRTEKELSKKVIKIQGSPKTKESAHGTGEKRCY